MKKIILTFLFIFIFTLPLFAQSVDTVGFTWYDCQHNNSQRRMMQVDYSGGLHFTWMNLVVPMEETRYVDYNYCCPWLVPQAGEHVTPPEGRGGYSGIDVFPDNREVLAYHLTTAPYLWSTALSVEKFTPGLGQFYHWDIPDSARGTPSRMFWPYVACAKVGTPKYIHITMFSEGADKFGGYVRCYQGTADTLVCQAPPPSGLTTPRKIKAGVKLSPNSVPYYFPGGENLTYTAAPVVTSPVSEKVAIVWCDEVAAWYEGEIYYIQSTNNGDDWMTGSNLTPIQITNYGANSWADYWTHHTEIAAVYDYNDVLHIFWTTAEAGNTAARTLWHWSPVTGVRKVASRLATKNTGARNYAIAKMTAGVSVDTGFGNPYDNYLYVVYTGFDDADESAGGMLNGDLYVKASSNGGFIWSLEYNMTNTQTPGCTPGNCESEHWASMAERVKDTLFVAYIYDRDAGGIPSGEGTFTDNPVRYLKYPRFDVPAVPCKVFTPTQMTEPVRWAPNGGSAYDTLRFENIGTATLWVKINTPPYITAFPNQFNIAELGAPVNVNLTFSGIGFVDTFLVGNIMIESNHGLLGGGEIYIDTEEVEFNFAVGTARIVCGLIDEGVYSLIWTPNQVFCWMGPAGNEATEITWQGQSISGVQGIIDEGYYCLIWTPSRLFYWSYVGGAVEITSGGSISGVQGIIDEGYYCLIWTPSRLFYWSYVGGAVEITWQGGSISSVQGIIYEGTYSLISTPSQLFYWYYPVGATEMTWQGESIFCYNPADVSFVQVVIHQEGMGSFGAGVVGIPAFTPVVYTGSSPAAAIVPSSASPSVRSTILGASDYSNHVLILGPNPVSGVVTGNSMKLIAFIAFIEAPDSDGDGVPDGVDNCPTVYNPDQTDVDGDSIGDVCDNCPIDYNPGQTDEDHDGIGDVCEWRYKRGDANGDGKVSVSDVIYLINYLFKGGPAPLPILQVGDANCDGKVTVSDVIYLINYLFKGGPPPC